MFYIFSGLVFVNSIPFVYISIYYEYTDTCSTNICIRILILVQNKPIIQIHVLKFKLVKIYSCFFFVDERIKSTQMSYAPKNIFMKKNHEYILTSLNELITFILHHTDIHVYINGNTKYKIRRCGMIVMRQLSTRDQITKRLATTGHCTAFKHTHTDMTKIYLIRIKEIDLIYGKYGCPRNNI